MQEVGIKVLKDKLSSYLKLVKEGEIIYVKDRNKIIAEIRKPTFSKMTNSRIELYLQEQENKGELIRAKKDKVNIKLFKNRRPFKETIKKSWREIYQESREDRS